LNSQVLLQLTPTQVQIALLATQGLLRRPDHPATKADVLETISRMSILQIDTIHVVARSPYLVLWSRLGDYQSQWLDELLAEGKIFEYWSHEACFLPAEDYPLYRRMQQETRRGNWAQEWLEINAEQAGNLLAHIRENGPVRSADFARTDGKSNGWWDWKPEKRLLEKLFVRGDLMVARRHNFHRIYDLRERVKPDWDAAPLPTYEEARRAFVLKTVKALGLTTARWVADYFRTDKTTTVKFTQDLAEEGLLQPVKIEGWKDLAYFHPDNTGLIEEIADGRLTPELTTLLSPFDPLVWDRARALALFGFDYRIECYTPAPKRRYGYFTLPILHKGKLVGRLDPKAHRQEGRFEVKALHLEPGIAVTEELVHDLAATLQECANWHKTLQVEVSQSDPPEVAQLVNRALAQARPSDDSAG
jgi:uncharacterized protein YcaQ